MSDQFTNTGAECAETEQSENVRSLEAIQARLSGVMGKPWKYNPSHQMFVGTTNALDIYYDSIDLGRNGGTYLPVIDETAGRKYVLSEESKRTTERIKALGTFLENCREDIAFLLDQLQQQEQS